MLGSAPTFRSPKPTIAAASKTSVGQASKTKERSDTLTHVPALASKLDHGAITAAHVDVVTRSSKQLDARQRAKLFDRVDDLAAIAEAATVDEFRRRVALEATRLLSDDGIDRLTRQQRNTRLRTWTDAEGMWCLSGRFDPIAALKVSAKLDTAVETLFAEATPTHCPTDPIERQQFLAAHALARLASGAGGAKMGRPEYVAVIDADAPERTGPVVEFAIPIELPARIIAELAGNADTTAVIVRNGVVLYAPGTLDQGRATRLANRANVGRSERCTRAARSLGVRSPTTAANCTTSSGGATAGSPISPICCQCAASTITEFTTTAGSSNSDPIDNSRSDSPTAPFASPTRPTEEPPPDRQRSGARPTLPTGWLLAFTHARSGDSQWHGGRRNRCRTTAR